MDIYLFVMHYALNVMNIMNKKDLFTYRRFWNQVFTCVSLMPNLLANSMRSCTLKYFWRLKHFSMLCNWWSVKAVRALRCFLLAIRSDGKEPRFESFKSSSSLSSARWKKKTQKTKNCFRKRKYSLKHYKASLFFTTLALDTLRTQNDSRIIK